MTSHRAETDAWVSDGATWASWAPYDASWGSDACGWVAGAWGWDAHESYWCCAGWAPPAMTCMAYVPGEPGTGLITHDAVQQQTAQVHFAKTYSVLSEIIEAHPKAFESIDSFVDFGCAPGGFSCRLLEANPRAHGYGATMPVESEGFPMIFANERLQVTPVDIMSLWSVKDIGCHGEVALCIADAQDLGKRVTAFGGSGGAGAGGRGCGKKAGKLARLAQQRGGKGVGAVCGALGIWALTLQELPVGFITGYLALRVPGTPTS
eukprot:NODE_16823_length_975_cov_3.708726.p1 GENE.NODE_16823_length_975_cov_3.708726~~NODE_16823_length_975_cov_3.708726.p1  ORF type:complete len:264 (+),score=56.71 NODE_16823_length_975_cov_3.708726:124-915(+)